MLPKMRIMRAQGHIDTMLRVFYERGCQELNPESQEAMPDDIYANIAAQQRERGDEGFAEVSVSGIGIRALAAMRLWGAARALRGSVAASAVRS